MIRAIPSNAYDNIYCTLLAQSAVHGTMAGFTGFTVGPVNSRFAYIPINVSMLIHLDILTLVNIYLFICVLVLFFSFSVRIRTFTFWKIS